MLPRPSRLLALVAVPAVLALVTACGAPADPGPTAGGSAPATSTSSSAPASGGPSTATTPAGALVIDVRLENGQVMPNGEKYDVTVGQAVVLNVISDHDDEVHVHSEPEVELEVTAGVAVSRTFTLEQTGSFEVESHHPEKIIAILNVR